MILVFPSESNLRTPGTFEALWLRIPRQQILRQHFEELWTKGKAVLPIIEEIKREIQEGKQPGQQIKSENA